MGGKQHFFFIDAQGGDGTAYFLLAEVDAGFVRVVDEERVGHALEEVGGTLSEVVKGVNATESVRVNLEVVLGVHQQGLFFLQLEGFQFCAVAHEYSFRIYR